MWWKRVDSVSPKQLLAWWIVDGRTIKVLELSIHIWWLWFAVAANIIVIVCCLNNTWTMNIKSKVLTTYLAKYLKQSALGVVFSYAFVSRLTVFNGKPSICVLWNNCNSFSNEVNYNSLSHCTERPVTNLLMSWPKLFSNLFLGRNIIATY